MDRLVLDLPFLFADHHVTEVRRILLALAGISDIYASSANRLVEVTYESALLEPEKIKAALEQAGYLRDMPQPTESDQVNDNNHSRRTTDYDPSTQSVRFSRPAPSEPQADTWPCPGMGLLKK